LRKGITPIIMEILIVLVVLVLATSYFYWSQSMTETFESTYVNKSDMDIKRAGAGMTIINVAGKEIGIKNTGRFELSMDLFSFYLNGSRVDTDLIQSPPDPSSLGPSQIAIFNVTTPPPGPLNNNYTVRVTGEYGTVDEVFAEMDFT